MASLAEALKQEILRLARKEVRSELGALKKQTAQYRRDIAALKRQVAEQDRQINFLKKQEKRRLSDGPDMDSNQEIRFSPRWLKKHRAKLGISAEDYGKLVGASTLSIYYWEQGKTNPRAAQRAKLAAVRGLGRREALKRLEVLEQ